MTVTTAQVDDVLKKIDDPEIHINIKDLGLIYGVDLKPGEKETAKSKVNIRMTLTSPACPYGPALMSKVHSEVAGLDGVDDVNIDLVWIPQWDPKKMASDEAKMQMGLFEMEDGEEGGDNK